MVPYFPLFVKNVVGETKDDGYEPVSKIMVSETIDVILGLDEKKLASIIKDTDHPMILRIVAKAMLEKDGFFTVEKLLNRSHGTPKQTQDVEVRGGRLMSLEEKDKEVMEGLILKVRTLLRRDEDDTGDEDRDGINDGINDTDKDNRGKDDKEKPSP